MSIVGQVESLWRYPVKSMRGEPLRQAYIGYAGVYGDRLYAFHSTTARPALPYLTGRVLEAMLLYQPRFRYPDKAAHPPNLAEAHSLPPGAAPVYAGPADLAVDVETPDGDLLAIDSPALADRLGAGGDAVGTLTLLRSDRAMTDCRPVSLISAQTVAALGRETGVALDRRRFRANICLDLGGAAGFAEDALLGRSLQIGGRVVVTVVERDPRCKMITLDPDTAQPSPEVLRTVARAHDGKAGVYAAVLVDGTIRPGDAVRLLT
ncbi:MOSC domain-containing protein [Rhodopila globiformis]|uniref:MOSC domain-containing protein n=1 Tax=Rhodopila globiformis TaxID=1071 RepID=A0A2S6NLG1_RHOGL|nr:MOSC domain-containing protein [Rhodopila globiformis]PPQ36108.1 MOSC domain-containing protein [Rhodopila globiformis]